MTETAAPPADVSAQYAATVRNHGYLFWGPIAFAILVAEVLGIGEVQRWLEIKERWPTISTTVGHFEDLWSPAAAVVVAVIAAVAFHALTYRTQPDENRFGRVRPRDDSKPAPTPRYSWWLGLVLAVCALAAGYALSHRYDDRYLKAYVIYGLLLLYGVIVPTWLIYFRKKEVSFPTLFFTFRSLRDLHPAVGKVLGAGLAAGLAVLVFHLALYPWPNLTREPAEYAGLTATQARDRAEGEIRRLGAGSRIAYSAQIKGIELGHNAWLVYFSPAKDSGLDSGCVAVVTNETVSVEPTCATFTRPGR